MIVYKDCIVDFIKDLKEKGIYDNIYSITYTGKGVSLNQFYSQGHWYKRHEIKRKYSKIFDKLLKASDIKWMDKFSIIIFYNSRHDVDNVVGMEKLLVDTLKHEETKEGEVKKYGYIHDDSKKYYKGLSIYPDDSLPTNTFKFILLEHK